MLINKNTTLEELMKYHKECLKHIDKTVIAKGLTMGIDQNWYCEGCQFYDPENNCNVAGSMLPCNWLLPDLEMKTDWRDIHRV